MLKAHGMEREDLRGYASGSASDLLFPALDIKQGGEKKKVRLETFLGPVELLVENSSSPLLEKRNSNPLNQDHMNSLNIVVDTV